MDYNQLPTAGSTPESSPESAQYSKEQESQQQQLQQPPNAPTLPPAYSQQQGYVGQQQGFVGQQQGFVSQQPMVVAQPYMYPPGQTVMAVPHRPLLPREMQPNDYIVVTLVVAIACGVLNVTSLFFSVPALICAVMAYERRNNGEYSAARQFGYGAIILSLLCVTWVMVGAVVTIGTLMGCFFGTLCGIYY